MKIILRIRNFFFALFILGSFASFAQNEYGLTLVKLSLSLISATFLFEGILQLVKYYKDNKKTSFYLFFENFFIAIIFNGVVFKLLFLPMAGLQMVAGIILLSVLYFFNGIGIVKNNNHEITSSASINILFLLALISGLMSFLFRLMHWQGYHTFFFIYLGGTGLMLLMTFLNRIKEHDKRKNIFATLSENLTSIRSHAALLYIVYSFCVVYTLLNMVGFSPQYYSLEKPPAYYKLIEEDKERAEIYLKNYNDFFEHRNAADKK